VSPYVRTVETAQIIAKHVRGKPEIVEVSSLEPHSRLDDLLAWTAERKESEAAWVGHAPDVSLLSGALLGSCQESLDFPKGGVAAIDFDDHPAQGKGRLRWFATAKLLGV
jgi:phosphohistidine phosphatase SixA